MYSSTYGPEPTSPNTTFVKADPSSFRAVVQKLTGAPNDPTTQKLPLTLSARTTAEKCPKRPAFKLHERRQSAKKLELDLNTIATTSPSCRGTFVRTRGVVGFGSEMLMVSPVSTLEFLSPGRPPVSPPCQEEERVIAEKGFYLHPSPLNTPRGSSPPQLLPLFPLHSPN